MARHWGPNPWHVDPAYQYYDQRNVDMRNEFNHLYMMNGRNFEAEQYARDRDRRRGHPYMDPYIDGEQAYEEEYDMRSHRNERRGGLRGFRGNKNYERDHRGSKNSDGKVGRSSRGSDRDDDDKDRESQRSGRSSRDGSPKSRSRRSRSSSRDRSRDRDDWQDSRRKYGRDSRRKSDGRGRNEDNSADSSDYVDHWQGDHSASDLKNMEDYRTQTPSNTVIIRGLAQHITEADIKDDIMKCGLMAKDIRLIRRKDTGASRGFAFVEFNTKQEASGWIELKQGELILQDQYRAVIHYSISVKSASDWVCSKCGGHNFRRRDTCYKCFASRGDSREGAEEREEVSRIPTHIILLRNLDVLTTEDSVSQAVKKIAPAQSLKIKNVRIGRDHLTNTSCGTSYIEMSNIADATALHDALVENRLEIDNKKVLVSYCKLRKQTRGGIGEYGILDPMGGTTQYKEDDIPRLAEYSASLYAKTPQDHATYLQYYKEYYQNQIKEGGAITLLTQTQADSVNAAAAVAQSAIQQVMASRVGRKQAKPSAEGTSLYYGGSAASTPSSSTGVPPMATNPVATVFDASRKYPTPDVSTYQYDKTSGYYYDAQTGLYYDANSQYYYHVQSQQFLYWDSEKSMYLPASQAPSAQTQTALTASKDDMSEDGNKEEKKGKDKDKQDRVKVAKKVVKEMEKWAKQLNQKKENAHNNLIMAQANYIQNKSKGTADIGFAVLERKEQKVVNFSIPSVPYIPGGSIERPEETSPIHAQLKEAVPPLSLVPKYGNGSDSEDESSPAENIESQFTNWEKMICLLCKRQFPKKDALIRHQQLSDLHKENLMKWHLARGSKL